jgi:hypothetical protein
VATVPILPCGNSGKKKNGSWGDIHLHKLVLAKDGYEKHLRIENEIVDSTVSFLHKSNNNL